MVSSQLPVEEMSRSNTPVLDGQESDSEGRFGTPTPLVSVAELPSTSFPAIQIPDNRYLPLTEHGTRRARHASGTLQNHIRGILGEFALANLLGIPDKLDTQLYENGDPGYDLQYRGYTIDVKTAGPRTNNPQLMVDSRLDVTADFYVLAQEVGARHYQVLGYAPGCLIERAPVKEFSTSYDNNRVRVMDQDKLFPLTNSLARETGPHS